jgi:hypothetical protein
MSLGGNSLSEGLRGRGGGSLLSLLPSRVTSTFGPPFSSARAGLMLSFCKRSRNASIPSLGSDVVGSGGALFACDPNFGRAGKPTLRAE